jgi:hypothetical protein
MASPLVAGIAALRFGEHHESTPADVHSVLAASSAKVGGVTYGTDPYNTCDGCTWQPNYGYGRVNLKSALSAATPPAPPSPPTTSSTRRHLRLRRLPRFCRCRSASGNTSTRCATLRVC